MKRMTAIKVVMSLLASLAWSASCAGDQKFDSGSRVSISEAAARAIQASRYLEQMNSAASMETARRREAEGASYPRLELGSSVTYGNNPVYVFGSLLEQSSFGAERFQISELNNPDPVTNVRTNLTIQLPLYDADQRILAIEQAKLGMTAVENERESIEQSLRLAVVKAYFGLLLAREREQATADAIQSAEADLKRSKDMHETGMTVRSDLLSLEVQLAEFKQLAIEAKAESAIAREGLNTLLGFPVNSAPELTSPLSERRFPIPDEPSITGTAVSNRGEVAEADIKIKKASEGVRSAESQYLPRVDAFGNYGFSSETVGVDSTDWTIGVRISFPIFDSGRSPRLDQARAAESGARTMKEARKEQVSLEALSAFKRFRAARERLAVAAGTVEQAKEAHRITSDRYQVGINDISDLLRSENSILRAHLGEAAARYNIFVGYAELLRATGTLKSVEAFE